MGVTLTTPLVTKGKTMVLSQRDLTEVKKEIAEIQGCDPKGIQDTQVIPLAVTCACVAYAKGLDKPALKKFVSEIYEDQIGNMGPHTDGTFKNGEEVLEEKLEEKTEDSEKADHLNVIK